MRAQKLTWLSPFHWLAESAKNLVRAPAVMTGTVLLYLFILTLLGFLPVIGPVLAGLFTPYGMMLIAEAGRCSSQGQPMRWGFAGDLFAAPRIRKDFVFTGLFYSCVMLLTNLAYALLARSAIEQWTVSESGGLDWSSVAAHMPWSAIICAAVIFFAGQAALLFTPMLIALKRLSFGKALFYSFFACLKKIHLFIILGLCWAAICLATGWSVNFICDILSLSSTSAYVMVPFGLIILTIIYGVIWPMWYDFFGERPSD